MAKGKDNAEVPALHKRTSRMNAREPLDDEVVRFVFEDGSYIEVMARPNGIYIRAANHGHHSDQLFVLPEGSNGIHVILEDRA